MNALVLSVSLLDRFVHGFTAPGFGHFTHFVLAHMALLGVPHCVTETLRLTSLHHRRHWTTPYAFLQRGRWACQHVSQCLLDVLCQRLGQSWVHQPWAPDAEDRTYRNQPVLWRLAQAGQEYPPGSKETAAQ